MGSLNAEPHGRVRSMREFFAIARAIETDAAERYAETSRVLHAQGFEQLARLFEHLAGLERGHVDQVEQWATRQDVETIPLEPWPIPDTFDAPPAEAGRSKLLTPYRALAAAVRHEQRAFAFWTYVAAHADRDDVKRAAEAMAHEELEHAALLRRERRRAYREERPERTGPISLAALAGLERRLARLLEAGTPGVAAEVAERLAAGSMAQAAEIERLAADHPDEVVLDIGRTPASEEASVALVTEFLAEAYLQLAESARDEGLMRTAQNLAATAIERLGVLDPAYPLGAKS